MGTEIDWWKMYQEGQISADHTDKEVFLEVIESAIECGESRGKNRIEKLQKFITGKNAQITVLQDTLSEKNDRIDVLERQLLDTDEEESLEGLNSALAEIKRQETLIEQQGVSIELQREANKKTEERIKEMREERDEAIKANNHNKKVFTNISTHVTNLVARVHYLEGICHAINSIGKHGVVIEEFDTEFYQRHQKKGTDEEWNLAP